MSVFSERFQDPFWPLLGALRGGGVDDPSRDALPSAPAADIEHHVGGRVRVLDRVTYTGNPQVAGQTGRIIAVHISQDPWFAHEYTVATAAGQVRLYAGEFRPI